MSIRLRADPSSATSTRSMFRSARNGYRPGGAGWPRKCQQEKSPDPNLAEVLGGYAGEARLANRGSGFGL